MKSKQVLCKALCRCINPVTGKYTYPSEKATFIIGNGGLKGIPNHFEAVPVNEVKDVPPEVETLLEMQIKSMTVGRIAQFMQVYYGVKVETGQAQETAVHQAIQYIRDPKIKRRPDSEVLAGLASIDNDTPEKSKEPAPIPSGQAAPVVPGKDEKTDDQDTVDTSATGEKLFKDMTPDDIDAVSREDIFAKVKRMYKVDLANTGNKTVVLNKAIEIETAELDAAAVKE